MSTPFNDMTVGMLSLGNFGMLLGCWADQGFGPAITCSCGCTAGFPGIGMWLGMLLFGNLGMALCVRQTQSAAACRWAMFGGGNLGMIVGMLGTGCAVDSARFGAAGHVLAMSAGMVAGMLAGRFLALAVIDVSLAPVKMLPHRRKTGGDPGA
jgi:hypothetical protein